MHTFIILKWLSAGMTAQSVWAALRRQLSLDSDGTISASRPEEQKAKDAIDWLNANGVNYIISGDAIVTSMARRFRIYRVEIEDTHHAAQFRMVFPDFKISSPRPSAGS